MDLNSRNKDWIESSQALENLEPFMMVSVQGLGRIDLEIISESLNINKKINQGLDLARILTLSQLWTLGAFELLRSIDSLSKSQLVFSEDSKKKIRDLKSYFAKIRTPLAKFQKNNFREKQIAYPIWFPEADAGWLIESNFAISRRDLADKLINLLKSLKP